MISRSSYQKEMPQQVLSGNNIQHSASPALREAPHFLDNMKYIHYSDIQLRQQKGNNLDVGIVDNEIINNSLKNKELARGNGEDLKKLQGLIDENKRISEIKKSLTLDLTGQPASYKSRMKHIWHDQFKLNGIKRKLPQNDSGRSAFTRKTEDIKDVISQAPHSDSKSEARQEAERRIHSGAAWFDEAINAGLNADEIQALMRYATIEYATQEVIQGKPYQEVVKKYQLNVKYSNLLEMLSARVLTDCAKTDKAVEKLKNNPHFTQAAVDLIKHLAVRRKVDSGAAKDKYEAGVNRVLAGESCTEIAHSLKLTKEEHDELEMQVAQRVIAKRINNGVPFAKAVCDTDINFKGKAMVWLLENTLRIPRETDV